MAGRLYIEAGLDQEKAAELLGKTQSYISKIEAVEKVDERDVLAGMGELLTEKQKAWVKTKFKSETLFALRLALEKK